MELLSTKNIVPMKIVHSLFCGLSRVTGTLFLERTVAIKILNVFFFKFEHYKWNFLHFPCIGRGLVEISETDLSKPQKLDK